jgi:hypothetical protein
VSLLQVGGEKEKRNTRNYGAYEVEKEECKKIKRDYILCKNP